MSRRYNTQLASLEYFVDDGGQLLTDNKIEEILSTHDVILSNPVSGKCSNYETFVAAHGNENIDALERAIQRITPEYHDFFWKVLNGKKGYFANLMILRKNHLLQQILRLRLLKMTLITSLKTVLQKQILNSKMAS